MTSKHELYVQQLFFTISLLLFLIPIFTSTYNSYAPDYSLWVTIFPINKSIMMTTINDFHRQVNLLRPN